MWVGEPWQFDQRVEYSNFAQGLYTSLRISNVVLTAIPTPRPSYNPPIHPPNPSTHNLFNLSRPLPSLPHKEAQAITIRRERDLGALGEIKHVARDGVHLLPGLVLDVELALDDDLHLVVRVRVDERRALFQTVEACRDGLFRVDFLSGKRG